jgi:lipopolysaccharide transport system permease protein
MTSPLQPIRHLVADGVKFPFLAVQSLWQKRELIAHFTWREFVGRYRGSHLGILLSLATPLILLVVYTLVFGVVFRGSFGGGNLEEGKASFALALFSGLIFFQLFADAIGRAAPLLPSNPNFITKVVFPLEILPVALVGSALLHFVVSLGVLLAGLLLWNHQLEWTVLWMPVVLLPVVLLSLGVSWFLAALGLYFRDLAALVPPILMALTFLSAIFYPVSAIPERLQIFLLANPLAGISELARGIFIFGNSPDWGIWSYVFGVSLVCALTGYFVFMRLKKGFSDAL